MSVSEWTDEQAIAHGRAWVDAGWQFKRWQVLVLDGQTQTEVVMGGKIPSRSLESIRDLLRGVC